MHSNWLPNIVKRSESGPYTKEADFDKLIVQKVPELIRKYQLSYDPEVLVPADDDLARRLFEAGMELFLEVGVFNMSTQRRILFSREEVESGLALVPREFTVGSGKDAVVMRHRGVESRSPCVIHSGPTGTPTSERYHPLILESCAQEPLVDCLGAGSVSTYRGEQIIPGTPLEILAVERDAAVARAAVRNAGRPGMHINDVASPLTCAGKISTIHHEWGLRATDGLLVSQMVELKTDYDQLSRVSRLKTLGMHIVDLMTPLIGGLGGGPVGTIIVTVACHLLGVMLYNASYHIYGHMHLLNSTDTDRMGLWGYGAGGQALALQTRIQSINAIYTRAGLGTEQVLWEIAAASCASTVSGLHQGGIGATGGSREDHTSGLENRFNAQVSHACLDMSREEANEFVLSCLSRYEETHQNPPEGKAFAELYNTETLEPTEEWLEIYHRVSEQLAAEGLDIHQAWKNARVPQ